MMSLSANKNNRAAGQDVAYRIANSSVSCDKEVLTECGSMHVSIIQLPDVLQSVSHVKPCCQMTYVALNPKP